MLNLCYRSGARAGLLPAAPAHFAGRGRPTRLPPQAVFETEPRSAELADLLTTCGNTSKPDTPPHALIDPDLARLVAVWADPARTDPPCHPGAHRECRRECRARQLGESRRDPSGGQRSKRQPGTESRLFHLDLIIPRIARIPRGRPGAGAGRLRPFDPSSVLVGEHDGDDRLAPVCLSVRCRELSAVRGAASRAIRPTKPARSLHSA
jgi:hypothetical protein